MSEIQYTCPDCGPTPIWHSAEKWSIIIDWASTPYNYLMDGLWRVVRPILISCGAQKLIKPMLNVCTFIGITKIVTKPTDKDSMRALCLWQEAGRRGIDMQEVYIFNQSIELFIATYKGNVKTFISLPRPDGPPSRALDWMDDKGIMKKKFLAAGLPVARGGAAFLFSTAKKIWQKVNAPVITKPNSGSRSRHTTIHINSISELKHGFSVAKVLSPWVIVEQELQGAVHRATVIGGTVVGVLRRDPPQVVGDGTHTVKELVDIENQNPMRSDEIFHKIEISKDADTELKRQNVTWESVPDSGRVVTLNQKVGRSSGASNADVTDQTHPDNIKLFEKVGEVLGDSLVGIDFIISDISKPWQEQQPCGVIECNSLPFIDLHHAPMTGFPRNAAGALWDIVMPQSKQSSL